ncbi:MAG: alpha/beta hydrolase-fold protein [Planctomycetaceae bacterium]
MSRCRCVAFACQLIAVTVVVLASSPVAASPEFVVTFDPAVRNEPYTGRVYVFFSRENAEPRRGPDWFYPEPFFAKDVTGWQPGEPLTLAADDPALHSFPKPLADLALDGYRAQAVARFNPWEREVGVGAGNGYGPAVNVAGDAGRVRLTIDRLVESRPYEETAWGKPIEVRSERLSAFHGRDVALRGTVILPSSYHDEPNRRYPTIFTIPGFGGDHRIDPIREPVPEQNERGVEFLRVMLNPNMPSGHHVFADSDNNGPVGTALVEEFLPTFDKEYRSIPEPTARFVTGHSSGGWSSLWLQVSHPDVFGGVWSTAPDPVDFHDFQQIDVYRDGENVYFDRDGQPRPLARRNGDVVLLYRDFDRMEQVLGHGGQLQSFEAVFGPKGDDGRPAPLWDRKSGAIDPAVAETWKRYDVRLVLEENWPKIGKDLAGKIHVFMGDEDTFYLEGAARLLKESLHRLGSDAVVELVPDRDHFTLLTPELTARMRREMTTAFLRRHPQGR